MADLPGDCDVAVIGAGPAGLAAAAELRACGAGRVIVLDRAQVPGGGARHCSLPGYGLREFRSPMRGPAYAARLAQAAWDAGALIFPGTSVTALHGGPRLTVSTPKGAQEMIARRVLICTGAREAGWAERKIAGSGAAGVLTTAELKRRLHHGGRLPFQSPLMLGTEAVAMSALLTCQDAGIHPVAIVEPSPRVVARWPAGLLPRVLGIPLLLNTDLVGIEGESGLREMVLRAPDGAERRVQADGLLLTGRYLPEADLLRGHLALDPRTGGPEVDQFGRCSDPGYFAAGNLLRPVETPSWCWQEGRRAARAIAASLRGALPPRAGGLRLQVEGPTLKYVMPQRLVSRGCGEGAADMLQLRVTRPVMGRLVVTRGGEEIWSGRIRSGPERRLTLPIAGLPVGESGELALRIDEEPR